MKNNFKLNRWYNYIFGEKFSKKLDFKWNQYPNRHSIIQQIIDRKKYKSYLEIGCDKDVLFNSIKIIKKIGVDPVSGGNIRMTSDDFFKNNLDKFDIIFIDGLHQYKQVKNDIINSLNGEFEIIGCIENTFNAHPSDWVHNNGFILKKL